MASLIAKLAANGQLPVSQVIIPTQYTSTAPATTTTTTSNTPLPLSTNYTATAYEPTAYTVPTYTLPATPFYETTPFYLAAGIALLGGAWYFLFRKKPASDAK